MIHMGPTRRRAILECFQRWEQYHLRGRRPTRALLFDSTSPLRPVVNIFWTSGTKYYHVWINILSAATVTAPMSSNQPIGFETYKITTRNQINLKLPLISFNLQVFTSICLSLRQVASKNLKISQNASQVKSKTNFSIGGQGQFTSKCLKISQIFSIFFKMSMMHHSFPTTF